MSEPLGMEGGLPPVILLPALGRAVSQYDGFCDAMGARGYDLHRLQRHRGTDFQAHVEQLIRVGAQLGPGCVVIGASYGGMVARCAIATARAREPDQEWGGLVLLDSPTVGSYRVTAAHVGPRALTLAPNPEDVDLSRAMAELLMRCPTGSLGALPLLVMSRDSGTWEGSDPDLPAADRIWMAHQRLLALLSTASHHRVLDRAGHDLADAHPDRVAAIVDEFVAEFVKGS